MKIIKRIVVENFRSLENIDISTYDINIFSGLNDTGKSNLLKALNLFFNDQTDFLTPLRFSQDFSKITLASAQRSAKKKQQIKVRVYFEIPSSFPSLKNESEVFFEKVWDREGNVTQNYSNDNVQVRARITRLLHKIKFFYVPALKGPDVLRYILGRIGEHQLISSGEINNLNEQVNKNLSDLRNILDLSAIKIKTSMGFPVLVQDFWEKLTINTEYDEFMELQTKIETSRKSGKEDLKNEFYQIPLELRGEGIKSKYIPPLLKWIQDRGTDLYVWGIDEPENSLEFRKAEEVADLYFNKYSLNTQLFATTHSFAFIFATSVKVQSVIFRCIKGSFGRTDIKPLNDLFEQDGKIELAEEVGALEIQKELYKQWQAKSQELQRANDLIIDLNRINRKLLLVEGISDKKIIETAWSKLYPSVRCPFNVETCGGASSLHQFIKNPALQAHNTVVALWDCDSEGYKRLEGLFNRECFTKETSSRVKHDSKKIYGIVLPTPAPRTNYTNLASENPQFQFLEIEHYFTDEFLSLNRLVNTTIDGKILLNDAEIPNLQSVPKREFMNFSILFDEIKHIMSQ